MAFHKEGDFLAFETILHEALEIYPIELYAYRLMPTHWHFVLRPFKR